MNPLLLLLACAGPSPPPSAQELCTHLVTESVQDCSHLDSSCFHVHCLPRLDAAASCENGETFPEALVSPAVLHSAADDCEARGDRWEVWDCGGGLRLVSCEAPD